MSLPDKIRAYLRENGPSKGRDVADSLGANRAKTYRALYDMCKFGTVTSDGGHPATYTFVREAKSIEERMAAAHAARDEYNAKRPKRTREERLALNRLANRAYWLAHREELLAKKRERDRLRPKKPRVLLTPEQKLERRRETDKRRYAKRRDEIVQQRKSRALTALAKRAEMKATKLPEAPKVERIETVEEWMARTGQAPQRLPGFADRRSA